MTLALAASPVAAGSRVPAPPMRIRTGLSSPDDAPFAGAVQPATMQIATRIVRSAAGPRRRGPRLSVRRRAAGSAPPVGRQAQPVGARRSGDRPLDRDGRSRACGPHVVLAGEPGQERDDAYPAPHAPEYTGRAVPGPETR